MSVEESSEESSKSSVYLVVQRYRTCKLLVDEERWVTINTAGMLWYVSFATSANLTSVHAAAETVLNLPVLLTNGLWGDGSKTKSIRQIIQDRDNPTAVSIAVVPQANLISKVKSQGKSIQYHGQIEKTKGNELYNFFLDNIRAGIVEASYCTSAVERELPSDFVAWKMQRDQLISQTVFTLDPAIPETQIFRLDRTYGSYDDTGFPITMANGEPVSKSAAKKLRKVYDAHAKRHLKYSPPSPPIAIVAQPQWSTWLENCPCQIVAGSFGKRQGLEIQSDMGPFCHVLVL